MKFTEPVRAMEVVKMSGFSSLSCSCILGIHNSEEISLISKHISKIVLAHTVSTKIPNE
jgi:hypothetical protein